MVMFATRRRRLVVALATTGIIASSLVGAAPASADDGVAITNPSFIQPYVDPNNVNGYVTVGVADNAIPGWRVTQGSVEVYGRFLTKAAGSAVVESGSQSIDLNGSDPSGNARGGVEQTLNTTPGDTVVVTFAAKINDHPWCAANTSTTSESLIVQFAEDPGNGQAFNLGSPLTPGPYATWQLLRVMLPATGRHSRLQILSTTPGQCGPLITDIKAVEHNLG